MAEHGPDLRDFMPGSPSGDGKARAGAPLAEGAAVSDSDAVIDALRTIHDPEIPVNIYELGLIYGMEIDGKGNVAIDMTLTAPACPVAGEMPIWVENAISSVPGVSGAKATIVFDPPWSAERMSDEAKMAIGWF